MYPQIFIGIAYLGQKLLKKCIHLLDYAARKYSLGMLYSMRKSMYY